MHVRCGRALACFVLSLSLSPSLPLLSLSDRLIQLRRRAALPCSTCLPALALAHGPCTPTRAPTHTHIRVHARPHQTRVFLFNFIVLFFSLLGMSSIGVLVQERQVFARERANGFYDTFVYALAKVIVCDVLPMRVLPPLFFGSIMYAQVGLNKVRTHSYAGVVVCRMQEYAVVRA